MPVIVREWRACLRSICFLVKAFQKQPSAVPFSINTLFNPIKCDSTSQWCYQKAVKNVELQSYVFFQCVKKNCMQCRKWSFLNASNRLWWRNCMWLRRWSWLLVSKAFCVVNSLKQYTNQKRMGTFMEIMSVLDCNTLHFSLYRSLNK